MTGSQNNTKIPGFYRSTEPHEIPYTVAGAMKVAEVMSKTYQAQSAASNQLEVRYREIQELRERVREAESSAAQDGNSDAVDRSKVGLTGYT
jgi:hypothetical protein